MGQTPATAERRAESSAQDSVDWVSFPGGELEGKRPRTLCPACREKLQRAATAPSRRSRPAGPRTLCFQCYRADLERERAMRAAGELDTASPERFQFQLPFEPVNRPRLQMLKAERAEVRTARPVYEDKRRRAQLDARKALQQIGAGLHARSVASGGRVAASDRDRVIFQAIHAAELQLPEAWLPFVVGR
jgi:hypothetical protein